MLILKRGLNVIFKNYLEKLECSNIMIILLKRRNYRSYLIRTIDLFCIKQEKENTKDKICSYMSNFYTSYKLYIGTETKRLIK